MEPLTTALAAFLIAASTKAGEHVVGGLTALAGKVRDHFASTALNDKFTKAVAAGDQGEVERFVESARVYDTELDVAIQKESQELERWYAEHQRVEVTQVNQTAEQHGNRNTIIQVSGQGNTVR